MSWTKVKSLGHAVQNGCGNCADRDLVSRKL